MVVWAGVRHCSACRVARPRFRRAGSLFVEVDHDRPLLFPPDLCKWVREDHMGFRRFSLRGTAKVGLEWILICLACNLRRLSRGTLNSENQPANRVKTFRRPTRACGTQPLREFSPAARSAFSSPWERPRQISTISTLHPPALFEVRRGASPEKSPAIYCDLREAGRSGVGLGLRCGRYVLIQPFHNPAPALLQPASRGVSRRSW